MSKLTFKTQAKHTALGLLGVAAPAIILSTYHGLYAATTAIACVVIASVVGAAEGYGFGKHHYDDLIGTQSEMIDRLQDERSAKSQQHYDALADHTAVVKAYQSLIAELERPKGWVIVKKNKVRLVGDNEGTDTYYLTLRTPGRIYNFVPDTGKGIPKDTIILPTQAVAYEYLKAKWNQYAYFVEATIEELK